jgi:RNA polymerase sigma factor for flagellar operon FliA
MQGPDDAPEVLERYQSALPLVDVIAGQISRSIGSCVDYDDLLGSGREGLFEAARKFDASRGVPFRAYASLRVRGAMFDSIRKQAHLPRRAHERLAALEAAMVMGNGTFSASYGSAATAHVAPGDAERRMTSHLASVATAAALGAATHSEEPGAGGSPEERLNPEEQFAQAELRDLIQRAIDQMAPDEAGVIRAYYFENKSMNDIAVQENLSKSWVCRLHAQAIARLTRRIKNSV